jgi:hypothetical protein
VRYRDGTMESRVLAHHSVNGPVEWVEQREAA